MLKPAACFLFLSALLSGCNSDSGVLKKEIEYADQPVVMTIRVNDIALEEPEQVDSRMFVKAAGFKFYLANISYKDQTGKYVLLRDAFLYDQETKNDTLQLVIPTSATELKFGIGVPPGINTGDPTLYGNKHPYSIKGSKGMHWGWATGYRFVVYEGKRDSVETGTFDEPFSFHTGTDSLYRELSFPMPTQIGGITLDIDGSKFFTGIDLNTDYSTHTVGNPDLARRFTDNFCSAISVYFIVH